MATWHQLRNPVALYHNTQWTVVIDPPNSCRAVARFPDKSGAQQYLSNIQARGEKHAYILAPAGRT